LSDWMSAAITALLAAFLRVVFVFVVVVVVAWGAGAAKALLVSTHDSTNAVTRFIFPPWI
jgi:hypothetical protein